MKYYLWIVTWMLYVQLKVAPFSLKFGSMVQRKAFILRPRKP